jgi:hypothetical protein
VRTGTRAGPSPRSGDDTISGGLEVRQRKYWSRNTGRRAPAHRHAKAPDVARKLDAAGQRPAPYHGSLRFRHAARAVVALVVLCAAPISQLCAQQTPPDNPEARSLRRLVQDASRALQAGNAASFLRWFDRGRFPAYAALESHVVTLTTQSDIASSIQIFEIEPAENGYRLRVDWLLQLSVKETPGPLETRRAALALAARETQKGKWVITNLDRVEFFRPQGSP